MQIHNRILTILVAAILGLTVNAQVLDLRSRHIVEMRKAELRSPARNGSLAETYLPSIIRLAPGCTLADLEDQGVRVMRQRDDLVLAFVPIDKIDRLITFSGINRLSVSSTNRPALDRALPFSKANHLIEPTTEMPEVWTGKGVVVGLTDVGLDPAHPNFLTPKGQPRIKRMVQYTDTLGLKGVIPPLHPSLWRTDNVDEWHATHVLGIMAGGSDATPYRGIASEAEIVASLSMLTDACILDGVEEIIDYAKSQGKPAVVNMSVGSYTGPHDGTTLFNQYLDKLGQEAIIVMSAGNEGQKKGYFRVDFNDQLRSKSVCITDVKWWNCQRNYGLADFWSRDGREFKLALSVRDMSDQTIVATFPLVGDASSREWEIASPGYAISDKAVESEEFNKYYRGYFRVSAQTDPDNGRFHILTAMDLSCTDRIGEMGRYFVTVTLEAEPGVTVDAYADHFQVEFNHGGSSKYARPNSTRSISDIACGDNVIVVGAATSRNTAPSLAGPLLDYTWFVEGNIAPWSSYGTLDDGRALPHIAAPGCYLVSSMSGEFVAAHPEVEGELSAHATVDGKEAWWVSECGTSMSAPYVAGVIALMLEANPELTVETVRNILVNTADHDMADASDPRWGAGKLNALAAMRELLKMNGVADVAGDQQPLYSVKVDGGNIVVESALDDFSPVMVYALDGRCVISASLQGTHTELDASALPRGIYLLHTPTATFKLKK